MKKLTCALVGFGGIGHHHASRYAHCKNVRLVALCDIDPARLAEAESKTNLGSSGRLDLSKLRLYGSYDEFAAAEKGRVDMVDLCVPTYEHARLACRALRDGFHVLSEKPMALSLAQCDAMIAAAAESGRTHMVAQCLRFSPAYEALRSAVEGGRFGALRSLSLHRVGAMPWSKWYYDHRKCGGAVLDLQLHDLDFAVSLLGTPSAIRCEGLRGPSGGWDETLSRLRYPGAKAPLVTTAASWLRASFRPGFEAVFERGLMEFDGAELRAFDAKRKPVKLPVKGADMYGLEIDYFADCVRRGARPERCPPESTRESVRLALLQMKSAARGGAWIRIPSARASAPRVSADFPGGSVRVVGIDGATVRLAPDLRDTAQRWFFWRFRADFPAAGTWRFEFDGPAVGTRGPAVRRAGERGWHWLSGDAPHESDRVFEWTAAGRETVEFCQCVPYQGADFDAFAATFADDPRVSVSELCRSRAGRPVPLLRLREGDPAEAVLLTCRHHAQESMASFALEGILRALASDEPWAREFRRSFEVLAVPFVDRDGVEDGTQGKNRIPHDHNRDYGAAGGHLYPETAAIDRILDERRPVAVLDLHCPWLRGGETNEHAYLVGIQEKRLWPATDAFGALLERHCPPEAPFFASDTLPFGALWNQPSDLSNGFGMGLSRWAATKPWPRLAQGMEIPFANFREKTQTPATVRAFGRGVAAALAEFL